MPKRSPEEVTNRSVRAASWTAVIFAVVFAVVGSDLEALGPANDRPGRLLLTIGFAGSALAAVWWIVRHATAPIRIRIALVAVDVLMYGTLLMVVWTEPSLAVRVTLYTAAVVLAAAAIELWRHRRRMGISHSSNERVSTPDQALYEEQALRQKPW